MLTRFMLVAMLLAAPSIAHAQLGKIVKQKAAQVAGKEAQKAVTPQSARTYHADRYTEATIGQELDQKTFEATLRGMTAVQNEYTGVQAERVRLSNRENELNQTAIPLDSAWRERSESIEQCQKDYVHALMEKRQAELTARAIQPRMDPQTVRLIMALTDSGTKAAQRGDSVEMERLNRRMMNVTMGIDIAADSAAAVKKCGPIPARPAAVIERDRVRAEIDTLMIRERTIQEQTLPRAASASGLPPRQFALARERILTWYADQSAGDLSRWSKREREMFERRKDEIRQALGYGK
jgi:hypothetical protein